MPVVFDFLNRIKEKKTIREQKVEAMIKQAKEKELEVKNYKFTANSIPKSTKEPLYKKILAANI